MTVHVSRRKPPPVQLRFLELAQSIDASSSAIAARTIPKSYRFVLGTQLADTGSRLAFYAVLSQEFYPASALAAFHRRRCYSEAIACAKSLKRIMLKAITLGLVTANRFDRLISDIDEFIACARGLKKNVKVNGTESIEDAKRWHLRQVDAIDALQSEHVVP